MILPGRIIPDSYWITSLLAAGEYPGAADPAEARWRVARFEAKGIRLFVDLTHAGDRLEPYEAHLVQARRAHHPIVDNAICSEAEMAAALDAIDDAVAARKPVYVHCWGGIGRTGTVVGCWLVRHGRSPEEAIDLIRERRRLTPDFALWPVSPFTREQHGFVHGWREGL